MRSYVLVGILAFCILPVVYGMKTGGISDTESDAETEVQGIVQNLSKEIKARASSTLPSSGEVGSNDSKRFENASLTALTYKTQVVAGTNYFVKIMLGDYIFHVRIYRDLKGSLRVNKVVGPKDIKDPIEYF